MSGHKTTHTQLERFKIIDSLLSDGRTVPFDKILSRLRTTLRDTRLSDSSVRRDLRYMRDELSAPISYDHKNHGWHYTKTYKLSGEHFSDNETLYLYLIKKLLAQSSPEDALYKSFDSLLEKISPTVFPSDEDVTIYDRFFVPPRPKSRVEPESASKILRAIKENRMIDFSYYSKWEPEETHRKILPYQLVLDAGSLYLYGANDERRDNPRLFKLSKMHNVEVLPDSHFELPRNFRFNEDFEKGRFGAFQYDESYEFKIAFFGEAMTTVREYVWADDQTLEETDAHTAVLSFTSSQWIPIHRWVLSFGENALPLEPDWFVEMWKDSVKKMAERL